MSEQPNGLYTVFVGSTHYFEDMTLEEGLSGLLTVANHFNGVAYFNDQRIAEFNK